MRFIIENQHGEIIHQRPLGDDEKLDLFAFTREWLRDHDLRIDHSGYVPLGCGDITAILTENDDDGRYSCWDSRSYFVR